MNKTKRSAVICFLLIMITVQGYSQTQRPEIVFCGDVNNDLYRVLAAEEGLELIHYDNPEEAVEETPVMGALIIAADGYPNQRNQIPSGVYTEAREKNIRLYVEYPGNTIPDIQIGSDYYNSTRLERGIVIDESFGNSLPPMSILGINDARILASNLTSDTQPGAYAMIKLGKVAGFDKAEYGLEGVHTHDVLNHVFYTGDSNWEMLLAMTKLTNFRTARSGPHASWKIVWETILRWLTGERIQLNTWSSARDVAPMYEKNEPLPDDALTTSVAKGVEWYYNGRFFIHPNWKEYWLKEQEDGRRPYGPPVPQEYPNGDGSLGILEGHASRLSYDGSQQYRYWLRADVQGETAYALAAGGVLLQRPDYLQQSENLMDFLFESTWRKSDRGKASFGLIAWAYTSLNDHWGDDNARAILGAIGASARLGNKKWNRKIVENILSNFRLSSKQGFQSRRLHHSSINRNGWRHYNNRDYQSFHPHFESWIWACYLWLYDKTGYEPLLEKARTAIGLTMGAYPDNWRWTNGIQQERARMILPLAWLVRVDDSEEHRQWLDAVVSRLLENQQPSGAIQEELGGAGGLYGSTPSNEAYGTTEAPLIFENGDPVADMLYTSNFAFFALNEAAHATGNSRYHEAVAKLSEFLARIQIKSEKHNDMDGGWFRAFEYERWDYWASNADGGWGAWGTLTGWIQSWIVTTQTLVLERRSYWELTDDFDFKENISLPHREHSLIDGYKDGIASIPEAGHLKSEHKCIPTCEE
ncbi:hypothetical protein GWK08_10010 [Leptobacterium flavescens]|uniref:Uncharacterized protein n=1 Tax=Leptobacterium flavescens TaxID=472055 RepID=A0A6P0UKM6_9FLAO|nr:hypothetical protein [Leptobacterium flavescens]NER13774.1 hypothetical protein [Leptobacterium flavescens]